jgi:hypothetical protein
MIPFDMKPDCSWLTISTDRSSVSEKLTIMEVYIRRGAHAMKLSIWGPGRKGIESCAGDRIVIKWTEEVVLQVQATDTDSSDSLNDDRGVVRGVNKS